jgi:hypothetical protein
MSFNIKVLFLTSGKVFNMKGRKQQRCNSTNNYDNNDGATEKLQRTSNFATTINTNKLVKLP